MERYDELMKFYLKKVFINTFHFNLRKTYVMNESIGTHRLEESKRNFDISFSKYMEFLLFKRVVFPEPNSTSPISINCRQIISIWCDDYNSFSDEKQETNDVLNDLTNTKSHQCENKNAFQQIWSKTMKIEMILEKFQRKKVPESNHVLQNSKI